MIIYGIVFLATVTIVSSGPPHPCSINSYGKFPHHEECQLYYDCSQKSDLARVTDPNLFECEYSKLFDADYKECRPFDKVKCGNRKVIKYICNTLKYRNPHAHSRPCYVDHLDCTDLADGKWGFPEMPNSPYYAECDRGRSSERKTCDKVNGQVTLFDPSVKECVKPDDN